MTEPIHMDRKKALKIFGFGPNDNPSKEKIRKARNKLQLTFHTDKNVDKELKELKEAGERCRYINRAYDCLIGKNVATNQYTEKSAGPTSEDLNINSAEDLKFHLHAALLRQDIAFLEKLFSKFKSSKGGKFGDYINERFVERSSRRDLPLFSAISSGNVELVRLLLDNGADLNVLNKYGGSPLYIACSEGHYSIVKLLLEKGVDPNVQGKYYESPLHKACSGGHYSIVKLLLEKGAPNAQDKDDESPLHKACSRGHASIVKLLLEKGVDPNVQDKDDESPLHRACSGGHASIVKLLLEKSVDPNVQDKGGRSPLHIASFRGSADIVELLLNYKAKPNVQDRNGESPLHEALFWWHYNTAELLLKNGANPNVPDKNGKFPLNRACFFDRNDIVRLLLKNGADPGLKDKDDKKPIGRVSPQSDGGKPFNSKKAFWLGVAAILATVVSIALISGVADAYIGEVWCFVLAVVIIVIALCCAYCAKTQLPPSGPASMLYGTSAEPSNRTPSPAG